MLKIVFRILLIFSSSTIAFTLIAQENTHYHLDQYALSFRDGFFANVEMVKKNAPIPATWIETDMEVDDRDFYKNITRSEEIVFFDDNGIRSTLDTKSIWGYSYKGNLYINLWGDFHKIKLVGRISYFVASKTTYAPNPFLDSYPDGSFWNTQPILIAVKNEEYVVDILENVFWKFDLDGLEQVLDKDPQLRNEFEKLKKRKKASMKYSFLLRYNQKYPLDIPFIRK